jgi:phospholipase/carboxylesterase
MPRKLIETDAMVQLDSAANPSFAIIWLHGLGADGHDFVSLVPELIQPNWPGIRFIFPHAPERAVTINGGAHMRAWYDIKSLDRTALGEAPGIRDSIKTVAALIEKCGDSGIAAERVFIAGFSQGGAVALCAALRHPAKLAGIIALSTYLPLLEQLAEEASEANAHIPVFMAHGVQDPVVPITLGEASANALRARGLKIDWHSYRMPHSLCGEEINDLTAWLGKRLV